MPRHQSSEDISRRNKWITIGLLALLLVGVIYAFRVYVPFSTGGALAVSTISIDPQRPGQVQPNGEYTGGHWVILADTATAYGTHCFYQFDRSQVDQYSHGNYTNQDPVTGAILLPNASIQLSITVGQPYLKSDLYQYDDQLVLPATYGQHSSFWSLGDDNHWGEYKTYVEGAWVKHGDGPISAQTVTYWRTQNNWQVVIPLDITCIKVNADGAQIPLIGPSGTSTYHVEPTGSGSINLQPFNFYNKNNPSETVTFTKVGLVSGGAWPSGQSMFILRNDLIWKDDGNVEPYVKYSTSTTDRRAFINDWFGSKGAQWNTNDDNTIYMKYAADADLWDSPNGYPGIAEAEDAFYVVGWDIWKYPIKVTYDQLMYSGTPYTVASGRPNSLAAWLDQEKGQHLNAWGVNPYTGNYQVDTKSRVIKLFLDQNSFLWLYTLDISTDVVDTYVWRPSYQTGVITDAHWQSGDEEPHIPVAGYNTMLITVDNTGNAPGGFIMKFATNPSDAPYATPDTPTGVITPGDPEQVSVSITNLGGLQQDMSATITVSLWNDNNEDQHSSVTLRVVFSAGGGQDTYLTVITKVGDQTVSGIQVTIRYGTDSQSEPTTGGMKTFHLGTYTGRPVVISTPEDDYYFGTTGSTTVHSGSQSYIVALSSKNQPGGLPLIVIVVVVVLVLLVLGAVIIQRRAKQIPAVRPSLTRRR